MKFSAAFRKWTFALALAGVLNPMMAHATDLPVPAATSAAVVSDVALHDGGVLYGQVLDVNGAPVASTPVSILQDGQWVVAATTDQQGRFAIPGLRGGVYSLATAQGGDVYRLWAPQTAPPAARNGVVIVNGDQVTRAQMSPSHRRLLVVGGIAGIAGVIGGVIGYNIRECPPATP